MKILIAGSNGMLGSAVTGHLMIRKVLLICGILSSLLYVAMTILGAMRWEGYSSISQTVSELFAIDAPSRLLVIQFMLTYSILMFAFGLGIWKSSGPYRYVRHPGYAGSILYTLAIPIILGSWWTFNPGAVTVGLLVMRAGMEDRTLQDELPGYLNYTERTSYRLFPGLW